MADKRYQRAIDLVNTGARYPSVNLVKSNPKVAAVMSKLVLDVRTTNNFDNRGNRNMNPPHPGQFKQTSMQTAQNISDAETVNQVLPDTDLAAQILVSSILSPKDMMQVSLTYVSEEGKWKLPQETSAALINQAREHFEKDYKIKPLLPKILRDVLFRTGSYSIAVIPENAVDDLINNTGEIKMESLAALTNSDGNMHPMGLLGPRDDELAKDKLGRARNSPGIALEALQQYEPITSSSGKVKMKLSAMNEEGKDPFPEMVTEDFITVTDNYDLLKLPELNQSIRQKRVRQILHGRNSISVESIAERFGEMQMGAASGTPERDVMRIGDRKLMHQLYKAPKSQHKVVVALKSQDKLARRSIGSPLVMHLPAESVIPVHVPNRPEDQIGFFVMIDQEGNPISKSDSADYYKQLTQRAGAGDSFVSSMLERSKQALNDSMGNNPRQAFDYSAMIYGQMLEEDINQRLRNGLVGGNAVIAKNEEVYRLMMARRMQQQHTQLLYIPAEFMTYIAFRYHSNGIGKSLLDDGKILNSMRTMLLVANVMASLRNSIGRTNVALKLDPDSTDPMKNIEQSISEIMRVNSNTFPLGSNNPNDIVESMQRAAFQFSFTGHPGLPDMEMDFSERNSSYAKPDTELEDILRKRSIMMYGLTPEMVDAAAGSDFATSVNSNTILLSKRVLTYQEEFVPQISDHLRKYMVNTADLMEELLKVIESNYDKILENITETHVKMADGEVVPKETLKTNRMYKAFVIKEILEEFIGNFAVQLPEPDTTRIDNEGDAYSKYEELLDKALNAWISEDMFSSGEIGTATDHVKTVRNQVKAYFLREWQMRNSVLPELAKITSKGDDGEVEVDFYNAQSDHVKGVMAAVSGLFKNIKEAKEQTDTALKAAGLDAGDTGYGGANDFSSGGGGDSGGFGGGDDGFGGGDMGGDMGGDLGGDMGDMSAGGDFDGGDIGDASGGFGDDAGADANFGDASEGGEPEGGSDNERSSWNSPQGDNDQEPASDEQANGENASEEPAGDEQQSDIADFGSPSEAGLGNDTDADPASQAVGDADEDIAEEDDEEAKKKKEEEEKEEDDKK